MKQVKKSAQQRANLRVCASCEWIFKGDGACPKCEFASYGARYVYGDKCYSYQYTQDPWKKNKLDHIAWKLDCEIKKTNTIKREPKYISIFNFSKVK